MSGTELAVLSACQTNIGEEVEGEGVFALSRGFLVGGVNRVLASQWAVNDQSTALLMGHFFKEVIADDKQGRSPNYPHALRQAQLALRNNSENDNWHSPYHWAPFVLIGKQ